MQPRASQAATLCIPGCTRTYYTGAMLYMMPLGRGVSKDKANWAGFGEPDDAFWCCYGTGVESFAKLNDNVYFEASPHTPHTPHTPPMPPVPQALAPPALWVSQFVPSTLHWRRGGATLHLTSELERDGCTGVQLTLSLAPLVPDAADAADPDAAAAPGAGCFGPEGCTIHLRLPSWADPDTSHVTLSEAGASGNNGGGGGGGGH
eukprot:scaffold134914_cov78-Phaeocystis_antarctica.AAC.1